MYNEVSNIGSYSDYYFRNSIVNEHIEHDDVLYCDERELNQSAFNCFPLNTVGIYTINSLNFEIRKENLVMAQLAKYYSIDEIINDIDFLVKNDNIYRVLPPISLFIRSNFNNIENISLKLLNEGEDWKTIFIKVYTHSNWDEISKFTDKFYDYLIENFPKEEKNINISFIS
jgi:hypothetical protein